MIEFARTKNILRGCYEYPPPWDGLTAGPFEISVAQVEKGHDIIFLAGGAAESPYTKHKGITVYRIGKTWPTYLFGPFFSFDVKLVYHIWKILKTNKINIIHLHGNTALWFNLLRLLGCFRKTAYVVHAHASGIKYFKDYWKIANYTTKLKALFIWPLIILQDFLTIRVANALIVVSQKDKDIFLKYYHCKPEKVFVVENGVNLKRFISTDNKANKDSLNLLYVGALRERKNIDKILSVLKKLSELNLNPLLTIVGRGSDTYIARLKNLAKELGVENRINWIGYVPYVELHKIYATHNIFMLLSYSEGLPKVIMEALGSGLKIVSTKSFYVNSSLNEIIEWVNVDDSDEQIAKATLRALKKDIDFEAFRKEYSFTKKASDIGEIYKTIISRNCDLL